MPNTQPLPQERALEFVCPTCGAPAGTVCLRPDGRPYFRTSKQTGSGWKRFHDSRFRLGREA